MGKGARNRAARAGQPPKPAKVGTPFDERTSVLRLNPGRLVRAVRDRGLDMTGPQMMSLAARSVAFRRRNGITPK